MQRCGAVSESQVWTKEYFASKATTHPKKLDPTLTVRHIQAFPYVLELISIWPYRILAPSSSDICHAFLEMIEKSRAAGSLPYTYSIIFKLPQRQKRRKLPRSLLCIPYPYSIIHTPPPQRTEMQNHYASHNNHASHRGCLSCASFSRAVLQYELPHRPEPIMYKSPP